jgi:hypothetical protein
MQWQVGTGMQQGPTWPHRDALGATGPTGMHSATGRDALTSGHRDAGHEWGIRRKVDSDY